jgi:hypothetical protein
MKRLIQVMARLGMIPIILYIMYMSMGDTVTNNGVNKE